MLLEHRPDFLPPRRHRASDRGHSILHHGLKRPQPFIQGRFRGGTVEGAGFYGRLALLRFDKTVGPFMHLTLCMASDSCSVRQF